MSQPQNSKMAWQSQQFPILLMWQPDILTLWATLNPKT
jgi:hypothetical protein